MSEITKKTELVRGFTLIEMVLTLALVASVAVVLVVFSLPVLGEFHCDQEIAAATMAIERARHLSQFTKLGDVRLEISGAGYGIFVLDRNSGTPRLVDRVEHLSRLPVTSNRDLVFLNNAGVLARGAEISIGGEGSSCLRVISINDAGAIL